MVTLSACETGLTDWTAVSEYVGLPSAFLYAGSPSVVSSLWRVNDQSTAFLMIKLYEILKNQSKNQKNVAVALNQAQLWLRNVTLEQLLEWSRSNLGENATKNIENELWLFDPNDKPFNQPYYWAAFCAIGQ